MIATDLSAAQAGDEDAFRRVIEPFRNELRAHCYRMSGSLHDAEELVQEAMLHAWKGLAQFEARSTLRTWLFRVATRVCLDDLERKPTRALPMDLSGENGAMLPPQMEPIWLEPCPTPLASTSTKEKVAFAFLSALQRLPPRQRAALILKEVVGYDARECAELLEMSVAAVNSALQRARATLDSVDDGAGNVGADDIDDDTRALLARYVQAWERADVDGLVALLRDDAVLQMPPLPAWLKGPEAIAAALRGMVLTPDKAGAFRLVSTSANGLPAFAMYEGDKPVSLHVLGLQDGKVKSITAFLDGTLFARFGLA